MNLDLAINYAFRARPGWYIRSGDGLPIALGAKARNWRAPEEEHGMSDGMYDLDRIFRELSETKHELDALPADASTESTSTERARLERRRLERHEFATNLQASVGDERRTPEIQTELASLKVSLTEVEDATIDLVVQHGGSALEASTASVSMDLRLANRDRARRRRDSRSDPAA